MYKLIIFVLILCLKEINTKTDITNRENKLKNNIHHYSGDLYLFKIANSTEFTKGYIQLKLSSREVDGKDASVISGKFKFLADGRLLYLPKLAIDFEMVINDEESELTKMDLVTKKMTNYYTFDNYSDYSVSTLKTSKTVDKTALMMIWPQKLEKYFFKGFMESGTRVIFDGYEIEIEGVERWEVRNYDRYLMIFSLFLFILAFLLNIISGFYEESRHLIIPMAAFPIILTIMIIRFHLPKLLYLPVVYHLIILIPFFKERKEGEGATKHYISKNEKSSFRVLLALSALLVLLSLQFQIGALMGCIYLIELTFTYEFCLVEKKEVDDRINQIFIFWLFFQLSSYMNHILFGFFLFSYGFLEPYRADLLWVYLFPCFLLNVIGVLKKAYPQQVSYFAEKLSVFLNKVLKWCNRSSSQEAF